jgi:hypothetical protein
LNLTKKQVISFLTPHILPLLFILDEHSNNVISDIELNENHSPVTSVCDNIGLNVSKQIKEKIIKGEYVLLENGLPVSLSDSNMQTLGQDTLLWAEMAVIYYLLHYMSVHLKY